MNQTRCATVLVTALLTLYFYRFVNAMDHSVQALRVNQSIGVEIITMSIVSTIGLNAALPYVKPGYDSAIAEAALLYPHVNITQTIVTDQGKNKMCWDYGYESDNMLGKFYFANQERWDSANVTAFITGHADCDARSTALLGSALKKLAMTTTSSHIRMGKHTKRTKRSARNIATSDPEKSKGNSSLFNSILKNTREAGKHILLKYEDGYYQVRPPTELTEEFMIQRHTYSHELIGKSEFEKGMNVRAKWNGSYRISKAIIVEVDSDLGKVNGLFDTLEGIRRAEGKKKNAPAKRSERMVNAERVESERNKRSDLIDRKLTESSAVGQKKDQNEDGGSEDSEDDNAPGPLTKKADGRLVFHLRKSPNRQRRSSSTSSSRSSRNQETLNMDSQGGKSRGAEAEEMENEEEWSENDWTKGEEARRHFAYSSDSDTQSHISRNRKQRSHSDDRQDSPSLFTAHGTQMEILPDNEGGLPTASQTGSTSGLVEAEKLKHHRNFHLRKAKEYELKLKQIGALKERKPKLKVPEIKWSFLKDPSKVDKTIYQRLDKSDLWVKKKKLQELQAKAKDMDEYARKLMWRILVPADEVIDLAQKKVRGVGFVKMFGKKNFESFLDHVHKFAAQQKIAAGGKWTNVPTTETHFKAKFTAALENRLKSIDKNSLTAAREEADDA